MALPGMANNDGWWHSNDRGNERNAYSRGNEQGAAAGSNVRGEQTSPLGDDRNPSAPYYTSTPLICPLCGSEFASDDLMEHMETCRRDRVQQLRLLPPPYSTIEVPRPTTLWARNLLPAIPKRRAALQEVARFNRESLDFFRAQGLCCERCGDIFPPNLVQAFKAHISSCDGGVVSKERERAQQEKRLIEELRERIKALERDLEAERRRAREADTRAAGAENQARRAQQDMGLHSHELKDLSS